MIDIISICFRNYWLIDKQIEHWKTYMKGDYRLIIVDNTPINERHDRPDFIPFQATSDFDGISSGQAYDFALSLAETDIVGLTDPDHFWLNANILSLIKSYFALGAQAVGCQGFYPDWQRIIDIQYPHFAGHLAPVLWGMFINRELALSETWICEPPGLGKITGWKVRQKIIDEAIPNVVFPGFFPNPEDDQVCFFGEEDKPQSVHFLKGCSSRANLMPSIVPPYLELGKSKWQ